MSKPCPGPQQILQSLDRLRSLASDLAERHARISDAARERERAAVRRAEAGRKSADEQRRASLGHARRELAESIAQAEASAQHRASWIRQAQVKVRKAAAQRAEAEEGKRKFEIQREMLRATRHRDAGLAAAKTAFETFSASLDTHESQLATLDRESHRLLGIYGRAMSPSMPQAGDSPGPDPGLSTDEGSLAKTLASILEETRSDLARFAKRPLPAISRAWPVTLVAVLSPLVIIPILQHFGVQSPSWTEFGGAAAGLAFVALVLHLVGRQLALPAGRRIRRNVGRARDLLRACREKSKETLRRTGAQLEAEFEAVSQAGQKSWNELASWLDKNRGAFPAQVDARAARILARNERILQSRLAGVRNHHQATLDLLEAQARQRIADAAQEAESSTRNAERERSEAVLESATDWIRDGLPLLDQLDAFRQRDPEAIPDRLPDPPSSWSPPDSFSPTVRFGRLDADLDLILGSLPDSAPPAPRPSGPWSLPLLLRFPASGSLLVESDPSRRALALGTLNHVICRLLAQSPPGRIAFTVFDPVGLGQSFAGLTHLGDEADHVIDSRIWTQSAQLEERLAELNDHLEKVIQMYLRNDFPTIAEYNEQAGNIAEKYRFLVIADFPAGFTDLALRRLQTLAATGARCGVFLLVHQDLDQPVPAGFSVQALHESVIRLTLPAASDSNPPTLNGHGVPGTTVVVDPPADTETVTRFIHQVARAHRDSQRVEVPFSHIAPGPEGVWSHDTGSELRVPIGRTGATKLQVLALGKATRQHALIAGKTGSGKSTLFHVLITNLSLWCAPDQVEFYLVDFKKGVEFKGYATHRLPHARVVAIESDRDFGLSVLQRLDDELRRRGELFRAAGVQDIAAYRRAVGSQPMPRVLLLVDEFQEFFVEEDRIAQNASVLLDRIVRQGRAFGIHVVLGSQTLGGAYTVARSTLGQMVVRIALQCNEADALLIMDEDNPAPRLLSRPGEAIYNDAAGARSGNSPFQVVWLPDEIRDSHLREIRERADRLGLAAKGPLVFEGDAPADVRENHLLRKLLRESPTEPPACVRTWLGAPNSIKGPTEVVFQRRSTDHVLLVGQRDDAVLAIFGVALAALAAQFPTGGVEFFILDGSPPGDGAHDFFRAITRNLGHPATLVRPGEAAPVVQRLAEELRTRTGSSGSVPSPARFLLVHGLQQFRSLRLDDEFAFGSGDSGPHPGALLRELISEGPPHGLHALVACDTHANAVRYLGRKGVSEFGSRVLFQMSANDSASLIDSPAASRLGLHRALLYQDREGHIEIFRPYALPETDALRGNPLPTPPAI
ncbi:MAG: FtsK/SpoIIIE domain-containing protein [Limisphaerales bacterium]